MANKSRVTLSFLGDVQIGAAIEFVALATRSAVNGTSIGAPAATYTFEESVGDREFTIAVRNSSQRSAEEFRAEIAHVFCAVHLLGGKFLGASGFNKKVPIADLSAWLTAQNIVPLSGDKPFDDRINLTLRDLQNIWRALVLSEQPVAVLLQDAEFTELFPYAELVAGTYERLRHASGCEVSLQTRKDGTIIGHRIDAPSPVRHLVARWKKTSAPSLVRNHGIYHADGYRGSDESRWRISKMLGAVPQQHKARVFAWVADVINAVDEFHNRRGGVPLPGIFECRYDDVYLVADHGLRFEQR